MNGARAAWRRAAGLGVAAASWMVIAGCSLHGDLGAPAAGGGDGGDGGDPMTAAGDSAGDAAGDARAGDAPAPTDAPTPGDGCTPQAEICGDGLDQDCDGSDLACACDHGTINAPCFCAGVLHSTGACCAGAWQASDCPAPGALYELPASRVTSWVAGVDGGIPVYTAVSATISAAAGDRTSAIQSALDDAGAVASAGDGRVVELGPGVFQISDSLSVPSYVVLRGAGLDGNSAFRTQLVSDGPGFTLVCLGSDSIGEARSVALQGDGLKDDTSVTLVQDAAGAGFAAGQLVLLDELTDDVISRWSEDLPLGNGRNWYARDNRPIADMLVIEAVSGATVSFTTPLPISFRVAQQAQLTRFASAATRRAGVEQLRVTIAHTGSGNFGYDRANINLGYCIECWARDFEADGSAGKSVGLRRAHRGEVRHGYIHDTQYYQNGGWGYGVDVTHASSHNLIEDNVIIRFNKVTNFRAAGGGNVVGYNYTDDGAISWNAGWIETGIQASHYPTPHFELFEGNYSFNADGDNTGGNAVYITFFRNHLSGQRAKTRRPTPNIYGDEDPVLSDDGNLRCAGAMSGHLGYNFVGNVLGWEGMPSWTYQAPAGDMLADAVWRLGAFADWSGPDPDVVSSVIRDGNWVWAGTPAAHWDGLGGAGSTPQELPDSLYLAGKPAFFGAQRWPWVDPLGTTKVYVLPAKARYEAGTPNAP